MKKSSRIGARASRKLAGVKGPRRPILRYFGGKWSLAPWIIDHFPPHHTYVEPFGGAGSVLLRKEPSAAEVYNDLDGEIVSLFRLIRDRDSCAELVRRLRRTPYARAEYEAAFEPSRSPMVRAVRTAVRYHMTVHPTFASGSEPQCFAHSLHRNGGYSRGRCWSTYPRTLASACRRLQGVVIERHDALAVIAAQDAKRTLFYVDPPYLPATRSGGDYRHDLTGAEHSRLIDCLRTVQGMVILSGYPSPVYDTALRGWARSERPARASGSKVPRTEVLWLSPATMRAMPRPQRQMLGL